MEESEWLICAHPTLMLAFALPGMGERKTRLLACACSRRVWQVFRGAERTALDVGEGYADGQVTECDRGRACEAALAERGFGELRAITCYPIDSLRAAVRRLLPWAAAVERNLAGLAEKPGEEGLPEAMQACLIRDVVGNPFRAPAAPPRTPDVVSLAAAAYEDRVTAARVFDPVRLCVLADALEEAGCDSTDLLAHLRSAGPHVRGCWAIDLILGKE